MSTGTRINSLGNSGEALYTPVHSLNFAENYLIPCYWWWGIRWESKVKIFHRHKPHASHRRVSCTINHRSLYHARHQAIGHCNPLACRPVVVLHYYTRQLWPCLGFRLVRWQKGHPGSATTAREKTRHNPFNICAAFLSLFFTCRFTCSFSVLVTHPTHISCEEFSLAFMSCISLTALVFRRNCGTARIAATQQLDRLLYIENSSLKMVYRI